METMDDKVKEKLKCVLDVLVKPFANIKDDTCLNKLIDFLQTDCMTIYLFLFICHRKKKCFITSTKQNNNCK